MDNNPRTQYITKYCTFDRAKVKQYPNLLKYFSKRKKIPELKALLEEQPQWNLYYRIGEQELIDREHLLQCMMANFCSAINFKYFWRDSLNLLLHIEFTNLKELTLSVDSDAGYMDQVSFVATLRAPNLEKLDLSNMEEGGFSLRPFRKSNFPKLQIIDFSFYENGFRDYEILSQAHFPCLRIFNQQECNNRIVEGNFWKAKMESVFMRRQLEQEISQNQQREAEQSAKRIKQE